MTKKKYQKNDFSRARRMREKKILPQLPLDTDLSVLFTAEGSHLQERFEDAVEETLSGTMISAILQEKENKSSKAIRLSARSKSSPPPPQAELDLHGLKAKEAIAAADFFLQEARRRKLTTVRIITGKGIHSQGEAVLRDVIDDKLVDWKAQRLILAFLWEQQTKLRSGSAIIIL